MSKDSEDKQPTQNKVEVTLEQLRALLTKPEDKNKVIKHLNKFDQNFAAWRLRDTQTEVYRQRGTNVQLNDQMRGVLKWMGTQYQMAYNLVLGVSTSLGGIKPAQLAMRQKGWLEKNAAGLVILGIVASMYFGFLYSQDFRVAVQAFLEPITTRIALAATLLVAIYLYWRQRKKES